MTRVLIVEDEESMAEPLAFLLRKEGFSTEIATNGPDALETFDRVGADIVLLDLMLPGMSGTEVCKQLRGRGAVPVIMVTAKDSEIDKVVGLELGADDYITKPYSTRELIARIRAVLRRAEGAERDDDRIARFEGWTADFRGHRLIAPDATEVELSAAEMRLLRALASRPQRVQTRETLMEEDEAAGTLPFDRSIDVRISRLRAKLREDPRNPRIIKTIYGAGYMFASKVEWTRAPER